MGTRGRILAFQSGTVCKIAGYGCVLDAGEVAEAFWGEGEGEGEKTGVRGVRLIATHVTTS